MKLKFFVFIAIAMGLLFCTTAGAKMPGPELNIDGSVHLPSSPLVRTPIFRLAPRVYCLLLVDRDCDGVGNEIDNCEEIKNADQADLDADEIGDVCDDDKDGDGVADADDLCEVEVGSDVTSGCPDADADSIADDLDECEDTAAGDVVDEFGCTVEPDTEGDADTTPIIDYHSSPTGPGMNGTESYSDGGCSLAPNTSASNALSLLVFAISLLPIAIRRKMK